jgi:hypothetical protein
MESDIDKAPSPRPLDEWVEDHGGPPPAVAVAPDVPPSTGERRAPGHPWLAMLRGHFALRPCEARLLAYVFLLGCAVVTLVGLVLDEQIVSVAALAGASTLVVKVLTGGRSRRRRNLPRPGVAVLSVAVMLGRRTACLGHRVGRSRRVAAADRGRR